jgi:hypothetical protein
MIKAFPVMALVIALLALAPVSAPAAQSLAVPITGSGGGATFTGTYTPTSFAMQNGQLVALGTVAGTVTNAAGVASGVLKTNVAAAVTNQSTGSCTILHLVLGPINLDLLGLQITTNQIVLDITAQSGPGNLLGNLLCAVANLLNSPGQQLISLLNQILNILNGL